MIAVAAGDSIELWCSNIGAGYTFIDAASLNAVLVNTVNGQVYTDEQPSLRAQAANAVRKEQ
jgi:hypothetical protein